MITIILVLTLTVISLVCGLFVIADAAEPYVTPVARKARAAVRRWKERTKRRIRRELMSRWLAEYGLTVVRSSESGERRFDEDEMMEIINRL